MYDYCKERNIPHDQKGKLIVATNPSQFELELPTLHQTAIQNGVDDLVLLSDHDVKQYFESQVVCHGALFSPSTGVIDSHSLMVSLLADAENSNCGSATLALNSHVDDVSVTLDGKLKVVAEGMELICDNVVNCAGLYAGVISQMIIHSMKHKNLINSGKKRIDIPNNVDKNNIDSSGRQYFAKGNYYRLQGQKSPFHHLVYPVPEKGGLGVHATIDLGGNTRFGPDVEWINQDIIDADEIDLSVDPLRSRDFYKEVRKYWPDLQDAALVPDYCGIRPKLGHPLNVNGPSIKADFKIEGEKDHGIKGFVNLLGIESPGLTSSLAIAETIKKFLDD